MVCFRKPEPESKQSVLEGIEIKVIVEVKNRLLKYEGELLLGLVRGLSLLLALCLLIFFSDVRTFIVPKNLLIGITVVYTIVRIIRPTYFHQRKLVTVSQLMLDTAFCSLLPFVSGGLLSPFILYPLTAILATAVYFRQKHAFLISAFVSVSVVISELVARFVLHASTFLPSQIYATLLAMYIIIAFLIAWLPYIANLNLTQIIKERAIIQERHRLSRELHDGPAQRLGGLCLKIDLLLDSIDEDNKKDAIEQTASLKEQIQTTYTEVREIIDQLRVAIPDDLRFSPTLAQITQDFVHSTGMNCQLFIADGLLDLKPVATVELLRALQEAFNNVKKHAKAKMIELRVESTKDFVKVTIRDDGKGFILENINGHHGLSVMKERMESIDGKFSISSIPGKGTVVELILPANSANVWRVN